MIHLKLTDFRPDVVDLALVTKQTVPFKDKCGFKKCVLLTPSVFTSHFSESCCQNCQTALCIGIQFFFMNEFGSGP